MAAKKMDQWLALGIVAALFNPLPTGIVAGYVLHRDKYTSGKFLLAFSVVWAIALVSITYLGTF